MAEDGVVGTEARGVLALFGVAPSFGLSTNLSEIKIRSYAVV